MVDLSRISFLHGKRFKSTDSPKDRQGVVGLKTRKERSRVCAPSSSHHTEWWLSCHFVRPGRPGKVNVAFLLGFVFIRLCSYVEHIHYRPEESLIYTITRRWRLHHLVTLRPRKLSFSSAATKEGEVRCRPHSHFSCYVHQRTDTLILLSTWPKPVTWPQA